MSKNRIDRLEGRIYGDLPPAARVCEILKAKAAGNEDIADRLEATCPRRLYRMADAAFIDRMEAVADLGTAAMAQLMQHAHAVKKTEELIEGAKVNNVGGIIARLVLDRAHELDRGDVDNETAIKAESEAMAEGIKTLDGCLKAWRRGLVERARRDWAGLDSFCRADLGIDAMTLLKGIRGTPPELIRWISDILEECAGNNGEAAQADIDALAELWRDAWRNRTGERQ